MSTGEMLVIYNPIFRVAISLELVIDSKHMPISDCGAINAVIDEPVCTFVYDTIVDTDCSYPNSRWMTEGNRK